MKNKRTITIGIPAYNEEANIRNLLLSLLNQKSSSFILKDIIVVSDGSSDNTGLIVKSINDERIKLIELGHRKGPKKAQNAIVKTAKTDVLVMLDADVLPGNKGFIEDIIKPIISDKNVGLVGADTLSLPPSNLLERIIADSHELKKSIYKKIRNGNNVYLCHGRARAFSRKLYPLLNWPELGPEDAYSYLFCIQKEFKFVFAPRAIILFRSPQELPDYLAQSKRFIKGKELIKKYFPGDVIKKEYNVPFLLLARYLIIFFLKNPLTTISFVIIHFYARLTLKKFNYKSKWEMAESTKKLI